MRGNRLLFPKHFNTIKMLPYIIALLWALINPSLNHANSYTSNGQVTVMDDGSDTGGETGTIPPKPSDPSEPPQPPQP
jgi:hypothetical protein